MAKEIISESRLREIISEEAARFKKKLTLEAEKKKLLKRLNEMYMEEEILDEEEINENIFKKIGSGVKNIVNPKAGAKDIVMDWLSKQDQSLVTAAKNQDEKAFYKLKSRLVNFLESKEGGEIGGKYLGLYLTPFFSQFGELGAKASSDRSKGFVKKHVINPTQGGLTEKRNK